MRYLSMVLLIAAMLSATGLETFIEKETELSYPEAMASLQTAISDAGYEILFIQPVDVGLIKRGYETGEYRIVFFYRSEDLKTILDIYPRLAALLPLRITLHAEGNKIRFDAPRPSQWLEEDVPPEAAKYLDRWEDDLEKIIAQIE